MASYISSNANRFYVALESAYGKVDPITAANRIPAVKLGIKQQVDAGTRRDKTGSRTFAGLPAGVKRRTEFELQTYLTGWNKTSAGPGYGPLFQSALGGSPVRFSGGTVSAATPEGRLTFASAHGLSAGQAVCAGGEMRFVTAIVDGQTVQMNAPFVTPPPAGATVGATVTYGPATELKSVDVFDYWSPSTAVQRMLIGAGVDQLEIRVNGDYHEFRFSGVAKDLVDSSTFEQGAGNLNSYPAEPAIDGFDYTVVPGHMGQAWLGTGPSRFCTITNATIALTNGLETRNKEFGHCSSLGLSPGQRSVTAAFDLYSKDDDATKELYQAARQQSPIGIMFQLGEIDGQGMAVYLKSVVPEVPEFDDGDNRLQWKFRASRAQGTLDDEISVAFG